MDIYKLREELGRGKSIHDIPLRVVYYTRVSTNSADQLNSFRNQESFFKDYTDQHRCWIFTEGYADEGITGTSVKNREGFMRMIKDAESGKFDLILTKEVSRFARNTLECLHYIRTLLKAGVGVYFLNDNISTFTNEGELRLTIMSSLAQDESKKISERVKFSYRTRIKHGKVAGNNKIWGYRKRDSALLIVEEEAAMVREIFMLYTQGNGFRKISALLAQKGFLNHNGRPFNFSSLKGILTNPKYKGYYCANKSTTLDFISRERKYFDKSQWVLYRDENIPSIVEEGLWDNANRLLAAKSEKMISEDRTSYQNKHPYSGKIFCNRHGVVYWHNVTGHGSSVKEVWQCKHYRQGGKKSCESPSLFAHEADGVLQKILIGADGDRNFYISQFMKFYEEAEKEESPEIKTAGIQARLEEVLKKKRQLLTLNLEGHLSNDEFGEENEKLNGALSLYRKNLADRQEICHKEGREQKEPKLLLDALEEEFDFRQQNQEELARIFLEKMEVLESPLSNVVILHVTLRTGQKNIVYLVNKNMHLSRSSHLIRADIDTEIAPLVGSEKQSEELLNYLMTEFENDKSKLWASNIFGKSLHELVSEGLNNKMGKMPLDARLKLKETLQRVINEGTNGLVCIII